SKEAIYAIFIRLNREDLKKLEKKNSKEVVFLLKNPKIKLKCFSDLYFEDKNLQNKVKNIKDINLHLNPQKKLMKKIQKAFNEGKIKIKE
ncbi:MAG: hypothetical protein ACFFG0_33660, partial [Candidatus Thorarchaeota archaeon]